MTCGKTCGRRHEGSLKCSVNLCNTFPLNLLWPNGSIAQIHFKVHWLQNVKKKVYYIREIVSPSLVIMISLVNHNVMFLPVESA